MELRDASSDLAISMRDKNVPLLALPAGPFARGQECRQRRADDNSPGQEVPLSIEIPSIPFGRSHSRQIRRLKVVGRLPSTTVEVNFIHE